MAVSTLTPYGFGGPPLQQNLDLSQVPQAPINPGMTGQQAILSRLQPSLDRQRVSLQTQLTNQGLVPGGEAYTNSMTDFGNQENDARQQAILAGLTLDQNANTNAFGQAVQGGDFANQASGQQFNQGLAGSQFAYQQGQDNRAIDAAQHNSMMSGLFGLGASVGAPLLGHAFGLGGAAAGAAGSAGAAGAGAGTAATTAAGTIAPHAATGVTGALGLGGGAGLFGLGAATIPVIGGAVAGIALLAKHFFGNGGDRKAANQLTGSGGVHDFFTQATQQIDQMPDGPEKQQAIDQRDRATEQALVDFSKIDKNHYYQAKQTLQQFSQFSTVRALLG
jgi:hypothetical protein